jgi:hypothetical protein
MEEETKQEQEEVVEEVEVEVVKEEIIIEMLPYNKCENFIPTEFEVRGFRDSWKACWCGRRTWMNDNYCPGCGQKLGMPEAYYDI